MENSGKQDISFELEQLREIAGIDDHLIFFKELYSKYKWKAGVSEKIAVAIQSIEEKQKDENLNISIVGEFSNGKSTFINALLRTNLLKSDVLQGTTTASTLIRYSTRYRVYAEYKNVQVSHSEEKLSFWGQIRQWMKDLFKRKEKVHSVTLDEVCKQLSQLTTDNELGKSIKRVVLEAPLQVLKNGIVIVDTPGTDSIERWHEDVTRDSIRNFSDASIILTTAESPCPDTLIRFIKSNLTDVLSGCLFVVSKMDLLRPSQRSQVLHYVTERIKSEFHLKNPKVLPFTPLFVLAEADEAVKAELGYQGKDYNELIEQSYQSEREIYAFLSQHRMIIQIQRLLTLSSCLYDEIESNFDELKATYEERHRQLAEAPTKELEGFIQEQIAARTEILHEEFNTAKTKFNTQCNQCQSQTIREAKNALMPLKNFRSIKRYITKTLSSELLKQASYLNDIQETYSRAIETLLHEQINEFSTQLFSVYPFLQRIPIDTQPMESRCLILSDRCKERTKSFRKAKNAFNNKVLGIIFICSFLGTAVGAFGGALLGDAILVAIPIGFFVGLMSASLFLPKFQVFKDSYWFQLQEHLENLASDWSLLVNQRIKGSAAFWCQQFEANAKLCHLQYSKAVDLAMEHEQREKEELMRSVDQLACDKGELKIRRESISDVQTKIQSYADGT